MTVSTNQHPGSGDDRSPGGTLPEPDEVFDAGSLGCGDGPLSRIAATLKRMPPGSVLEVRSTNPGVSADLPAWCQTVGHDFLGERPDTGQGRYIIKRKDD
ncbi:hypothetical protein BH23CHL2_BH23CHL2_20840 [soil metagenome]